MILIHVPGYHSTHFEAIARNLSQNLDIPLIDHSGKRTRFYRIRSQLENLYIFATIRDVRLLIGFSDDPSAHLNFPDSWAIVRNTGGGFMIYIDLDSPDEKTFKRDAAYISGQIDIPEYYPQGKAYLRVIAVRAQLDKFPAIIGVHQVWNDADHTEGPNSPPNKWAIIRNVSSDLVRFKKKVDYTLMGPSDE